MNAYLKAIYASITAGLGALSTVLVDHPQVAGKQWVAIISSAIVAFGATYGVTNGKRKATARRMRRTRGRRDRDQSGRFAPKKPDTPTVVAPRGSDPRPPG